MCVGEYMMKTSGLLLVVVGVGEGRGHLLNNCVSSDFFSNRVKAVDTNKFISTWLTQFENIFHFGLSYPDFVRNLK